MSTSANRTTTWSMRCYRGLLRAYPRAFLMEFEELLCQAFGDLSQRAIRTQGVWGMIALWLRTIPDVIASALSQRLRSNSDWRFRLRWIAACASGALAGALFLVGERYLSYKVDMWLGILPSLPRSAPGGPILPPRSDLNIAIRILRDAASFGLVLGFFQSLTFEWKRAKRLSWMLATMLGVVFAVGGVMAVPVTVTYWRVTIHPWRLLVDHHPFLFYSGSAAFCASIPGILQTLVLARRNLRAMIWIPASAVGIAACGFLLEVSMSMMRRPHSMLTELSFFGLIVGIAFGILTALPLEWILQPRRASDLEPKALEQSPIDS